MYYLKINDFFIISGVASVKRAFRKHFMSPLQYFSPRFGAGTPPDHGSFGQPPGYKPRPPTVDPDSQSNAKTKYVT